MLVLDLELVELGVGVRRVVNGRLVDGDGGDTTTNPLQLIAKHRIERSNSSVNSFMIMNVVVVLYKGLETCEGMGLAWTLYTGSD